MIMKMVHVSIAFGFPPSYAARSRRRPRVGVAAGYGRTLSATNSESIYMHVLFDNHGTVIKSFLADTAAPISHPLDDVPSANLCETTRSPGSAVFSTPIKIIPARRMDKCAHETLNPQCA